MSEQLVRTDAHVEQRPSVAWTNPGARSRNASPWWRWTALRCGLDATLLATALALAGFIVGPQSDAWSVASLLTAMAGYATAGLYRSRLRLALAAELRGVLTVNSISLLSLAVIAIAVFERDGAGDLAAVTWLLASAAVTGGRLAMFGLERAAVSRLDASRRTLVIGAGRVGHLIAKRLQEDPRQGLTPIGFLDKDPVAEDRIPRSPSTRHLRVLGASWDLEKVIAEHGVEQVIVAFSTAPHHVLLDLVRRCWALDVNVMVVPRLYEIDGRRARVEHLGALPLVSVYSTDPRSWQFELKYALDRAIAAVTLLLLSPLLAVIAAAVKVTMGGPVVFRQRRVGRDGHHFDILKFRTMRGAPERDGEANGDWARLVLAGTGLEVDEVLRPAADRRTSLGKVLRALSLDELPQLWNVLRGDMSLVGPRPEMPHYVERFTHAIYRYPDRHRVKSGLTGWAQIHGLRGDTSLADRIEWDNFYIENWNPWLDLKILLLTLPAVLRRQGAS